MKPARFILNSDYTTVRETGHIEMSITIPNSFTAPPSPSGDYYNIGTKTATIGDASDSFLVYFTSSRYDYKTFGFWCYTIPDGSKVHSDTYGDTHDDIYCYVNVSGNTATFTVECLNHYPQGSVVYSGYGQTITAHVLTFKDSFTK